MVAAVPQCEGLNNGEAESSASRLERPIPGVNKVISMEHARVGLARQKTAATETLLQREYLDELIKWMEEARAGRASRRIAAE